MYLEIIKLAKSCTSTKITLYSMAMIHNVKAASCIILYTVQVHKHVLTVSIKF